VKVSTFLIDKSNFLIKENEFLWGERRKIIFGKKKKV
jgi:hypothetical protein